MWEIARQGGFRGIFLKNKEFARRAICLTKVVLVSVEIF